METFLDYEQLEGRNRSLNKITKQIVTGRPFFYSELNGTKQNKMEQ